MITLQLLLRVDFHVRADLALFTERAAANLTDKRTDAFVYLVDVRVQTPAAAKANNQKFVYTVDSAELEIVELEFPLNSNNFFWSI